MGPEKVNTQAENLQKVLIINRKNYGGSVTYKVLQKIKSLLSVINVKENIKW